MMPLLLVAVINTVGDSHHSGADGHGGSRILLTAASPTESRSFAGRNLAMGRTGGGGEEEVLAATDSVHVSTAEGAGAWSGSDSEHAAALRRRSSNRRLATSTSTLGGRGGSFHKASRRGRALQSTTATEWVDAHNVGRTQVGVPGLIWSDTVASSAASWASHLVVDCQIVHTVSGYGENLAISWTPNTTISDVVAAWADERRYYNYTTNTCSAVCGHYTQVVWATTKQVGCAISSCNDGSNAKIYVCRYNPPGNYRGQKPYVQSGLLSDVGTHTECVLDASDHTYGKVRDESDCNLIHVQSFVEKVCTLSTMP
ncbi:hypothetical protein CBR_g24404 [Chara braunii]|uniref:SCP domain-containing protein n=1 Tax=Chara braunii TaxID=69332 RepID=A0A388JMN9_CHABU|nr:hypothetical protein CBR_g24404 [Chara braunii]|eukprot:GBG59058.1 hypothetical protein CBR_g24404 [Chara braunii]